MVTIIVLCYNHRAVTLEFLHSLWAHTDYPFELVVVDNASTDDSAEAVAAFLSEHRQHPASLLRSSRNLGFAAGNNLGLRHAKGEHILFLNNDVLLCKEWLKGLVECFEHRAEVGAVGPVSNHVGGPQLVRETKYGNDEELQGFGAAVRSAFGGCYQECWRLVGFCLLTSRQRLDHVGAFDERFGLGNYEDTDLCLRLVRQGYRNYFHRGVFVHHHGSRSFEHNRVDLDAWLLRNGRVFVRKWEPEAGRCPYTEQALDFARRQEQLFEGRRTISGIALVRDEEPNLPELFDCLLPVVDEAVFGDTGSTDSSVELIRRAGAVVRPMTWADDFSAARNQLLQGLRGDWVFSLDADERLSLTDQALLLSVANDPRVWERYEGVRMIQRNYTDDPSLYGYRPLTETVPEARGRSGYLDIPVTRLFKRKPSISFKNRCNDNVEESIRLRGGLIGQVDLILHHHGLERMLERFYFRMNLLTLERQRGHLAAARRHLEVAERLARADHERKLVAVSRRNLTERPM